MSEAGSRIPADVLLLNERRRRLGIAAHGAPGAGELVMESDTIVAEGPPSTEASGDHVMLYRPLRTVTLAQVSWSEAVDHETLQTAIGCVPARSGERAKQAGWLAAVATLALAPAPDAEPSLCVWLAPDDVAALERVGMRSAQADALALARAAVLPASICNADASTVAAAAPLLVAYRRAALVFAWQQVLQGTATPDTSQERDASAVQVVSMLRALLGET